jgi:hypothetical protein
MVMDVSVVLHDVIEIMIALICQTKLIVIVSLMRRFLHKIDFLIELRILLITYNFVQDCSKEERERIDSIDHPVIDQENSEISSTDDNIFIDDLFYENPVFFNIDAVGESATVLLRCQENFQLATVEFRTNTDISSRLQITINGNQPLVRAFK